MQKTDLRLSLVLPIKFVGRQIDEAADKNKSFTYDIIFIRTSSKNLKQEI